MRFLWKYLQKYVPRISGVMGIKMAGTVLELMIPYVMEHLIDHVVYSIIHPTRPKPRFEYRKTVPGSAKRAPETASR